jgi:hypothetical protein
MKRVESKVERGASEAEPIDPYLWDGSGDASSEVSDLERLLSPLAYRDRPAPLPERAAAVRRLPRAAIGAVGVLALAAAVAMGWFAGRSVGGPSSPTSSQVIANTHSAPTTPIAPASSAPIVTRPSPCVATAPPAGALHYEVLAGAVSCDGIEGPIEGHLPLETWFETSPSGRVVLDVADLGRVELAPSTRLRILPATADSPRVPGEKEPHRLELVRGVMSARIDAPPRLFIVQTRAAAAVDLGCAYSLEVGDDGGGLLRVGKGEVALETEGRSVVVHRGEVCETRVGPGAGTPFGVASTAHFRRALSAWDFEHAALADVLSAATKDDTVGLIRALERAANATDRGHIVDRLDALGIASKPDERGELVSGDAKAIDALRVRVAKAGAAPPGPSTPSNKR